MSQNWDATAYDSRHRYVFELAGGVVDDLDPQPGETILDLGCGTGHLSQEIARRGATVVGIDQSPDMIEKARASYPGREFIVADALSFQPGRQFDAVFSNAVLHWIQQPERLVKKIRAALKPGGRFVAEFGGKGNTASVIAVTGRNPWYFPSLSEYASILERNGFEVVRAMLFDRPTPLEGDSGLRDWLQMYYRPPLAEETIAAAEAQLRPQLFRNGAWLLDYRRLRIAALRVG
jgi:trans-aconitate methyltransferase